jgi:arabinose-5-phosphate isomerase
MGDAISSALVIKKGIRQRDFAANHPSGQLGRNNLLKVSDVMKSNDKIPKINSGAKVKDAIIEISNKGLGCVCIMENNKLTGILTDGDIRRSLLRDENVENTLVDDIMTNDPVKVQETALLGTALSLMENRKSKIGMLPVVDSNGNLTGIVQIHDIFGNSDN